LKLLLDHNLSPRLVSRLADLYPGSSHVYLLGLETADDRAVWEYARQGGYTVVSKDSDYNDLSVLLGFPPKLVWIRRGNCSVREIEAILRVHHAEVASFLENPESGMLILL